MSLQLQGERKQAERKFKSINLDISILNGLTKPSGALKDIDVKPKVAKLSMNDLSSILINKNKKLSTLQGQKKQAVEWLKQKGLDWKKINLEIKENAILAEQKATITRQKQLQSRGIQSVIGIKGHLPLQPQKQIIFTKQMQDEFIQRQKQVHLCKVIMKSLTSTKQRSNTRAALMNKIKGEEVVRHGEEFGEGLSGQYQQEFNQEIIKNQYFDFVHALSTNGFDSSMHLLKKIRPFWKIILQHIKTIQHYAPQLYHQPPLTQSTTTSYDLRMNQYLMIKSLKMIQRQFQKTLPDVGYSFEKLDEIVRDMQRRNRRLRVWRNSNGEATWAMTFMLLKAGRINEIKRVLESVDRDILWSIITHNLSINSQKPQKSLKSHDIHKYNDTFYMQIIRILQGIPTFDKQIFTTSEPYLTRVWILLITIGIYRAIPEMNDYFNTMNDGIISAECKSVQVIDEGKIEQYLYLGNYKKFIYLMEMIIIENKLPQKLNSSSFMYDDYFHLMVVLFNYPEMWGNSSGKQLVGLQGKYAEALTHYMKTLRYQKNKSQLPYYLMLCQGSRLQRVATNLITTANEYQQFDWRTFRDIMKARDPKNGFRMYKQLSKTVIDSLALTQFNDFLFAAQAYHVDFEQCSDSTYLQQKCYVKLLIGYLYFLQKKRQLLRSNMSTQDFNYQMHIFFGIDQEQKNQSTLSQRDNQIRRKVKQCEDKLQSKIFRNSTDQEYVSNVLIPFGFYKKFSQFIKLLENQQSTIDDLKRFDTQWTKGLSMQQKHQFQEGAQPVLLKFLGFEFSQQNYSDLYIYYLNELIERKRLLCSIDCDYTGVVTELRQIAGLLRHLQAYYQQKLLELRKSEGRVFGEEKRMLTEEATNPLIDSEEYRRLKETIKQMIGEDVEVRGLEEGISGLRVGREITSDEKRRAIKQRYNASEYFGQEVGY